MTEEIFQLPAAVILTFEFLGQMHDTALMVLLFYTLWLQSYLLTTDNVTDVHNILNSQLSYDLPC